MVPGYKSASHLVPGYKYKSASHLVPGYKYKSVSLLVPGYKSVSLSSTAVWWAIKPYRLLLRERSIFVRLQTKTKPKIAAQRLSN